MRHALTGLLLLAMLLSVYPLGNTSPLPAGSQRNSQVRPNFYFNDPAPLDGSTAPNDGNDLAPGALVTSDGTLWVAWQSNRAGFYQIFYQSYNGISWTIPATISAGGFNSAPSLAQLANGTIVLVWAAGTNGNDNHLYFSRYTNGAWNGIAQLTSGTTFTDELPKAVVNGTRLWIFFERDTSTGPTTAPLRQVYYKTLLGNVWSSETPLTTDSAANQQPDAAVLRNGNIWVTWARNTIVGGSSTIYYRTFNGTQWSVGTPLASPGILFSPNLVQDRNGTIWLYWSESVHLNATVTQDMVRYVSSTDVGNTWSSTGNLTLWGSPDNPINNLSPFAVQGRDTSLYVFFATDVVSPFSAYGFDIYYIQSSPIYPVHSVAVTGISIFPLRNYPYGDRPTNIATITVTVSNPGDYNENVPVTVQTINKTGTVFWTSTQTSQVLSGLSLTFTFSWNVSKIHPGRYTVLASIPRLTGESLGNFLGNSLNYHWLIILYAGDVNHDGVVNTPDFVIMGQSYGTTCGTPRFLPDGDLNRNCKIDTPDFVIAGQNYGKSVWT
ncbi:hypothetical protein E6H33_09415 [Candidatus Bathyarchaeota archaeon]|nr:MAG: hypothetical protein E6H33_09415 [Candidatus Bathyarchaeota archaeon]